MKKGLFIVIEGIDGSGKGIQINMLHDYIKSLSKYNDVLTTHEPWKNDEIKKILKEEKDAYSSADKVLDLFIQDRKNHLEKLIKPAVENGIFVISDRYLLSTYAYQNAQGVKFEEIKAKHELAKITPPDITFLLHINLKTALDRVKKRGESLEKFEREKDFVEKTIDNYYGFAQCSKINLDDMLGRVEIINGEKSREKVFEEIKETFDEIYY